MPKQNWSRFVITFTLSLIVLGAVSFYVTARAENSTNIALAQPSVTFLATDGMTPEKISIPGNVSGKGILSLGKFAVVRLEADARVRIQEVNFDPKLASIKNATLELVSGHAWLANLAFGQEFQISVGDLTLKNSAGEISLAASDAATQIVTANGDVEIILAPTDSRAPFHTFLASGKNVTLDPENIFKLGSEPDASARKQIWAELVTNDLATEQDYLNHQLKQDGALLATLTNRFLTLEKRAWLQKLWRPTKKYLTFLPAAKERYWLEEIEYLFDSAVVKNAESATHALRDAYANATDAETSAIKQRVLATFIPFTRLILTETLPEKTKLIVTQLAKLETSAATLAKVTPLSTTLVLARALEFAEKFPTAATNYLRVFSAGVNEELSTNDAALLLEKLTTYLQNNPEAATPELLAAQQTLATARDVVSVESSATITKTENTSTTPETSENTASDIESTEAITSAVETTSESSEPASIVKSEEAIAPVVETPPEPIKIPRPAKSITPPSVDDGKIARPSSVSAR